MKRLAALVLVGLIASAAFSADLPKSRAFPGGNGEMTLSLAFSPDSKTLAAGGFDNKIRVWDVATGKQTATMEGHTVGVFCLAFSPDGKTLASGGGDESVKLWNVAAGKKIADLEGHIKGVMSVAFSPDGKLLASCAADAIMLWNVADATNVLVAKPLTNAYEKEPFGAYAMAYAPDGKALALTDSARLVALWDIGTRKTTLLPSQPGQGGHTMVVFSPDGKTLASNGGETLVGEVNLWDLTTGKPAATLKGDPDHEIEGILSMAFTPDGKTVIATTRQYDVALWDLATGKLTATFRMFPANAVVWGYAATAFSPDGKTLAMAVLEGEQRECMIHLWDVEQIRAAAKIALRDAPVRGLRLQRRRPLVLRGQSPKGEGKQETLLPGCGRFCPPDVKERGTFCLGMRLTL